jgi:hypothetical protein
MSACINALHDLPGCAWPVWAQVLFAVAAVAAVGWLRRR